MNSPRTYEKAHFLVYSNLAEPFATNAENYCQSALNVGFDTATHYTEEMLRETSFWSDNAAILEQDRGAGYWLWKPYIVLEKLRSVGPNDIVIYNDAGRYEPGSFAPFPAFPHAAAELAARSPNRFIHGFMNDWLVQGQYTKRDCLILMDADEKKMHFASQVSACPLLYMPSEASFTFLEHWLKLARDPRILTDKPNELGENLDGFRDHRHDMAISSILAHQTKAHYFDLSKNGAYLSAEDVRRRNRHVPRCQTHVGYLSLMVQRALRDDFFVSDDANIAEATVILRNIQRDENVPQHPEVAPVSTLRTEAVEMMRDGLPFVTRDHVRAILSDNRLISGRMHHLIKNDDQGSFWQLVEAEINKGVQSGNEEISKKEVDALCMAAFRSAEQAFPAIRHEMMAGYIWGCLNDDMRALFKSAHRSAKSARGQSALRDFVTDVGPDALVPADMEESNAYHAITKSVNEAMCRWLTVPGDEK